MSPKFFLILTMLFTAAALAAAPASHTARDAYAALPISFEPNQGQAPDGIRFIARSEGGRLYLTGGGAVVMERGGQPVRLSLSGANPAPETAGLAALPGRTSYFRGKNPKGWIAAVPQYAAVKYSAVYPGIDLVFHGSARRLEYDLVVAPGADPSLILVAIDGARVRIDAAGDLVLETPAGEVRQRKPIVYQELPDGRRNIDGHYVVRAGGRVGVAVGAYDRSHTLVIDPVLQYATFAGGGDTDSVSAMALDPAGNAYIAGSTSSTDLPSAALGTLHGSSDAFVIKLNAAGTAVLYSAYIGGSSDETAYGIAVDRDGNAYVAGGTHSTDFPTVQAFQAAAGGGDNDGFLAKLNPGGTALVYSTYLGGSGLDTARAVAVDALGSAYVTGETESENFPVKDALQPHRATGTCKVVFLWTDYYPCPDAFVTRFDPSGQALVYSTYLGGTRTGSSDEDGSDRGYGIAVDGNGNAYVVGTTFSSTFPVVNPLQLVNRGGGDAFVAKLNPTGSALVCSTYLGGSALDQGYAIAVDGEGSAYLTGYTASADFPTANPVQAARKGTEIDAYVAKINPSGTALVYSTYLGGSDSDEGNAIAVDSAGRAAVAGYTFSTDFPTVASFQALNAGSDDAFVAQFSPTGSLLLSSYYGGREGDAAYGIAVDGSGSLYLAGDSDSAGLFTTAGAALGPGRDPSRTDGDGFVVKIVPQAGGSTLTVLSAASYTGHALAAEMWATAFGSNLAEGAETAAVVPLPTVLAGLRVNVTDSQGVERPAPLSFVNPTQVNFLVPTATANGPATISVVAANGTTHVATALVETVAPALFTGESSGSGPAAAYALHYGPDYKLLERKLVFRWDAAQGRIVHEPIDLGPEGHLVYLELYGTGIRGRSSMSAVKVKAGGLDCPVVYAGVQPDFAGLDQVNVQLPRELFAKDEIELVMLVDGKWANTVTVFLAGRPAIASITPDSAQVGGSVDVVIAGSYLNGVSQLKLDPSAGVTVSNLTSSDTSVHATLALAADASLGDRKLQLTSPAGTSDSVLFVVRPPTGWTKPFIHHVNVYGVALGAGGSALISGTFKYDDSDGDIYFTGSLSTSARLEFDIVGMCTLWTSGSYLDQRGATSGTVTFAFSYGWSSMYLSTGSNYMNLLDAAGNESNYAKIGSGFGLCP